MGNLRARINSHLPILLQVLSTGSLIVIAISSLCASKSLKKLSESHSIASHYSELSSNINCFNKLT